MCLLSSNIFTRLGFRCVIQPLWGVSGVTLQHSGFSENDSFLQLPQLRRKLTQRAELTTSNWKMLVALIGKKCIFLFLTLTVSMVSFLWLSMRLHLSLPVLEQTRIKLRAEKPGVKLEFADQRETKTPWPEDLECKHYQGKESTTNPKSTKAMLWQALEKLNSSNLR